MNLEAVLAPVDTPNPSGPNLYDSPARPPIELAVTGRLDGEGKYRPSGPTSWPQVLALGNDYLAQSKDLRIAIFVVRALTNIEGVQGLARGLALLAGMIEQFWPSLYPELRNEGTDPSRRLDALESILDNEGLLSDVRKALLAPSVRRGEVNVMDVAYAAGIEKASDAANKPLREIDAILAQACERHRDALEAAASAKQALLTLDANLARALAGKPRFPVEPLARLLRAVEQVCRRTLVRDAIASAARPDGGAMPDWSKVEALCADYLNSSADTKDLVALAHLVRARTRVAGLSGLADGLGQLTGHITERWKHLYPPLEGEKSNAQARVESLQALIADDGLLQDVASVILASTPDRGELSVADVAIARGILPAGERSALSTDDLAIAFRSADAATLQAAGAAASAASALEQALTAALPQGPALPLEKLRRLLGAVCDAAGQPASAAPDQAKTEASAASLDTTTLPATAAAPARAVVLPADARRHVRQELERLRKFLEEAEPSNPASLFIRRAESMLDKSFLDILSEFELDNKTIVMTLTGSAERQKPPSPDEKKDEKK